MLLGSNGIELQQPAELRRTPLSACNLLYYRGYVLSLVILLHNVFSVTLKKASSDMQTHL